MSKHETQAIAAHEIQPMEVHELPLFTVGDPWAFLSGSQQRDVTAMQAESLWTGDDFAEGLHLDFGRVI